MYHYLKDKFCPSHSDFFKTARTIFRVITICFKILQHHPFKMMHLIYRLAGLTGQLWQMESSQKFKQKMLRTTLSHSHGHVSISLENSPSSCKDCIELIHANLVCAVWFCGCPVLPTEVERFLVLLFIGLVIMYLQCYFELFCAVHILVLSIRVSKNDRPFVTHVEILCLMKLLSEMEERNQI